MAENDLMLDVKEQKFMSENTILAQHLKNNARALSALSEDVALASHCVNLGTAREGLITNFLKHNLPQNIEYHSGELFDYDGKRSGQMDIVLHPNSSPKINLHGTISLFPVETVLAVIEVKSNINTQKLKESMRSCYKIKNLSMNRDRQSYGEEISLIQRLDLNSVPFIVFAYDGLKMNTLLEKIEKIEDENAETRRPDLIVVLKRNYSFKKIMHGSNEYIENSNKGNGLILADLFELLLRTCDLCFQIPRIYSLPVGMYMEKIVKVSDFL